jgi:hypothetical protein
VDTDDLGATSTTTNNITGVPPIMRAFKRHSQRPATRTREVDGTIGVTFFPIFPQLSTMTHSDLQTLARWMSGQFDNLDQSQRDPAWFVALRLWCQPLPPTANAVLNNIAGTEGAIGLFVEQAPLPAGDKPYRQRLFLLCPAIADRAMTVEYFGFHDQRPYIGAGLEPSRLAMIDRDAIQTLNNAQFPLVRSGDRFVSRAEPDQVCSFKYGDQQGFVSLGFEISETQWLSFDQGIDPKNGQSQWGALMGPYELKKRESYA